MKTEWAFWTIRTSIATDLIAFITNYVARYDDFYFSNKYYHKRLCCAYFLQISIIYIKKNPFVQAQDFFYQLLLKAV